MSAGEKKPPGDDPHGTKKPRPKTRVIRLADLIPTQNVTGGCRILFGSTGGRSGKESDTRGKQKNDVAEENNTP